MLPQRPSTQGIGVVLLYSPWSVKSGWSHDYDSAGGIVSPAFLSENTSQYPELTPFVVEKKQHRVLITGNDDKTIESGIETYTFNKGKGHISATGTNPQSLDIDNTITITYIPSSIPSGTLWVGSSYSSGGTCYKAVSPSSSYDICIKQTSATRSSLSFSGMTDPIPNGGSCVITLSHSGSTGKAVYNPGEYKNTVLVPAQGGGGHSTTKTFLVRQGTNAAQNFAFDLEE